MTDDLLEAIKAVARQSSYTDHRITRDETAVPETQASPDDDILAIPRELPLDLVRLFAPYAYFFCPRPLF